MEDEASTSLDGKGIGNLRVVDLKQELEKRGLSKSGSKKDLVKRLKQQLEFEKLCEERKTSGGLISVTEEEKNINSCDFDRKLELDAAIEQNEFVQQYLAQQQKRYAERKEAEKRLEMEAQKQKEDPEPDSGGTQMTADKDEASDTDDDDDDESADGPSTHVDEPSKTEQNENIDKEDTSTSEVFSTDKRPANSETEDEEPLCPSPPSEPEDERVEQTSPQPHDVKAPEKMKENISVVVDINENVEIIRNISPPSSPESVVGESRTPKISEPVSECKDENENISAPVVSDSVKEQTGCIVNESVEYSDNKIPENLKQDLINSKDSEISQNIVQDVAEQIENVEPQSNVAAGSEEDSRCDSSNEPLGGISRSENLFKQDLLASMEPSECSPVPYSLSDIKLPESPGHHLKCKEINEEKSSKTDSSSEQTVDQSVSLTQKVKSNGVAIENTLNSSNEKEVSDSESGENNSPEKSEKSPDKSPEKPCQKNESESNQQTGESSDIDSDKNNSKLKTKCVANDDASSNIDIDSVENAPKDNVSKEQKSLKRPQQLDESDDGKSSDSEKYKSSRLDSRHKSKSHGKLRKRNRHSRSRSSSSSSSSSHSSDSSPKRRHSKKSVVSIKSKNFVENEESNQMSEKSSDDKPDKLKNEDSLLESPSNLSSKRRLKIKRDNVPLEISAASVESVESVSSRSLDNITCSVSQSASEKPPKQESTEARLSFSELSYVPRKVSLANRKLNRKSSEDKNNEPKSKRNKWESFAAAQKTSQTISISTDSLKTWFPDFKLMSEPASSMELEPDEHSLPAADEKNDNFTNIDVSNINDNSKGMKQESTLQMDVEDSESREPDFEDSAEQGPVSKLLFIQNLVRPFTLNQLKDLLKQNGKIVEECFWIDKIKSKCFVMYETEKEAIKARNSLNNTRWPSSNPKILSVEYSNEEEMEQHKKGNERPRKPVIEPPVVPEIPDVIEFRISHSIEDHNRKIRERRKEREKSKHLPPMEQHKKGNERPRKPVIEPPVVPEIPDVIETRISHSIEDHNRKIRERRKEREKSKHLPPMEQHKKGNERPRKPVIEPPVVPEIPDVIETRISHSIEDHNRKIRERRKEREKSKHLPPMEQHKKGNERPRKPVIEPPVVPEIPDVIETHSIEDHNRKIRERRKEREKSKHLPPMEHHKKGNEPPPKPVIEPPVVPEIPEVIETRISHSIEDHNRKIRERRKEREKSKPLPPVREWDKDKVMQDSPEREHTPKEEKSRSSEKKEKKESKKRPNEDTPAKLLDDLFQKTKNPPCIYWLPLTEEQAKQKEEAKKMRKLEREKRNQQLKEQEEAERRSKRARSNRRSREKENRKSSTRSRSPVTRRR